MTVNYLCKKYGLGWCLLSSNFIIPHLNTGPMAAFHPKASFYDPLQTPHLYTIKHNFIALGRRFWVLCVPLSAVRCTHECIIISAPETQNKVYSAQLSSYKASGVRCPWYSGTWKRARLVGGSEEKDKRCMCALNPKKRSCHKAALVTCSNKVNCSAQPNLAKQRARKKVRKCPAAGLWTVWMDVILCAGTSAKSF